MHKCSNETVQHAEDESEAQRVLTDKVQTDKTNTEVTALHYVSVCYSGLTVSCCVMLS